MTRRYHPVDPAKIKTYSARKRKHKADLVRIAALPEPGSSAAELLASWPDQLGAVSFRKVVAATAEAVRHDRPVVAAFGAHVIKVGCGPILIDLMKRGIIRVIACNGACAIHDAELAIFGETSEEVAETIRDGSFGMVEETMAFFDRAVALAKAERLGLGEAVGRSLLEADSASQQVSVFAAAHEYGIPATVHAAIGTDTVHVSDGLDSAALGESSMKDFRLICDVVSDLGAADGGDVGGVWLNIGSAVVLPEVFLKAVSVARNLGANLDAMTTANFDMLKQYRPHQNVVSRPVVSGRGHEVIGHHEIMLPLFRQAVIEDLASNS